jgi:hypothetical protein
MIINSHPPVTDQNIRDCEHEIARAIPEPYRSFLLRHNGGEPRPEFFEWIDEDGVKLGSYVRSFFGIHGQGWDTLDSLAYCNETYLKRERVPLDLFPVAADGGSNLILLGAHGERKGKVYFWDHNWEADDGEPPTYRNVHPLADSFEAFLAMLHEELTN